MAEEIIRENDKENLKSETKKWLEDWIGEKAEKAQEVKRVVVFDIETTGCGYKKGDKIVEIGAVELINGTPSGRVYQQYVNPNRSVPKGAYQVHGLSREFLDKFPLFEEIADGFLNFIGEEAEIVAHNGARFDVPFINYELEKNNKPAIDKSRVVDTLHIAENIYGKGGNKLDDLCEKFGIDKSGRTLHGALLDSQILAEVYLRIQEIKS